MLNIGCHLSITKGYFAMGMNALKINANTFQFFTRNPRGWGAKEIVPADAEKLRHLLEDNNFAPTVAHASYTINLSSPKEDTRQNLIRIITEDLSRIDQLSCRLYNLHPGNYAGQDLNTGIDLIIDGLNKILKPEQRPLILLETMSGKSTEIGGSFEELQQIIEGIELKDKIGVCIDTCHIFDAGYDIVNDLDGVLTKFDKIIGLDKLYAIHINDSKNPLGSRKDRHEKLGDGYIGFDAIARMINHPELNHLPFILETPNDIDGYAEEIKMLRDAYKN